MFGHLRVRGPHERVVVTTRFEDFDKIDGLMHSTEAAVSGDCCGVFESSFKILKLAIHLLEASVHLLLHLFKPFIHLVEAFVHLVEAFVHLLEAFVHLLEASIDPLLHFPKLRRNKLSLTERLLPYSLVLGVEGPAKNRETPIDIFKRWLVFGRWSSSGILGQLAHHDQRTLEIKFHV